MELQLIREIMSDRCLDRSEFQAYMKKLRADPSNVIVQHPWLDHLGIMVKTIAGEVKLPHEVDWCDECDKMRLRMMEYNVVKMYGKTTEELWQTRDGQTTNSTGTLSI